MKKLLLIVAITLSFLTITYTQINSLDFFKEYSLASINGIDSNEIIQNRNNFYSFLESIKKDIKGKNPKKDLKIIFDKVHAKYFIKYEENPEFNEIFKNGNYNCVTASALYSLVFEYFKIPYQLKEMPTHVYALAYPNEHNILVESTMPSKGIMEIQKKEMEKYKEDLIANKIATKTETEQIDFFTKFLNLDSIINKEKLNAIQYYNLSLKLLKEKKFEQAIELTHKAKTQYSNYYIEGVYTNLILELISDKKYITSLDNVYKLLRHHQVLIEKEDEKADLTRDFIVETINEKPIQNNLKQLKEYKNKIAEIVKDSLSLSKSQRMMNLHLSEVHYNMSELDSSLHYLKISYDSTNSEVFPFINQVISRKYMEEGENEENLIKLAEEYEKIFKHIKNEKILKSVKIAALLSLIYREYELNHQEKGDKYYEEFKKLYKPNDGNIYAGDSMGAGFGAASAFYIRKNNYPKAKEILKDGLKYSANSLELNRKLKLLED